MIELEPEQLQYSRDTFRPAGPRYEWLRDHVAGWQFGEQGVLKAIVEKVGVGSGRVCEVGAGNGSEDLPVTLDFLYKDAYRFSLWERNREHHAKLKERYPGARIEGECRCLAHHSYGDGVVVIDVDSIDWYLFSTLLATGEIPRICMVEHRDGERPQDDGLLCVNSKVQATSEQLVGLARGSMTPVAFTRVNTIFVRDDLAGSVAC